MSAAADPVEREPLAARSEALPWQQELWRRWHRAFTQARLPHAVLLNAPRGTGAEQLVQALARYLLCPQRSAAGNCGRCRACELSAAWVHSDFKVVEPQGKSLSIGVDAVRELTAFATQTSALGEYKVAVLCEAERMTLPAANALLKILEEPPEGTFFILSTHSPASVPATVRSRCQLSVCPLPAPPAARQWLMGQGTEASEAEEALALCGGRPLTAMALIRGGELRQRRELYRALLAWLGGDGAPPTLHAHLGRLPVPDLLQQLQGGIASVLRGRSAEGLRATHSQRLLRLSTELVALQRAVAGGANPRPDLLYGDLSARIEAL